MSILVVGSVAFDSIETPHGKVSKVLGGAATHFALAASYFTDVRVIGVVGEDFGAEQEAVFTRRGIDIRGIEHAPGLSFHWTGAYGGSMNEAKTLGTDLNVFETFSPKIPAEYEDSEYLFLANIDPVLQTRVRKQMPGVKLVCGDTMNYWISAHAENLAKVLKELDVLLINDGEARMLTGEHNLVKAAAGVLAMGPAPLPDEINPWLINAGKQPVTLRAGGSFVHQSESFALIRGGHLDRFRCEAFPGSGAAARGGGRSDRRGGFVCRRLLWVHRVAAGADACGVPEGAVLWRRDGVVCGGTVWHGAAAGRDAGRDRGALQIVFGDLAP